MRFQVSRSSEGAVSREPPCPGAERGPEAKAWPGDYPWFIEVNSLEELMTFLEENGGAIGVFSPEEGETHPAIEIFDDTDDEE